MSGFNPTKWLEGRLLKPGIYNIQLLSWDERFLPDGRLQVMLRFHVAENQDSELIDWWREDTEPSLRRAAQAAHWVEPSLLQKDFPSQADFFRAVLEAMNGKWLRALITQGTRPDGTPVARIKSFLGLGSGPSSHDVPF